MLELRVEHELTALHDEILEGFRAYSSAAPSALAFMDRICHELHEKLIRYNWVGFYLVDPVEPGFLRVGPYVGSFNHPVNGPNARIPFSMGLCGAAATSGQSIVVNDVSQDPRYLSGLDMVKSEIVIPIFANRKLVAELDINSYFEGTFGESEQQFDEACAAIFGEYVEKTIH